MKGIVAASNRDTSTFWGVKRCFRLFCPEFRNFSGHAREAESVPSCIFDRGRAKGSSESPLSRCLP